MSAAALASYRALLRAGRSYPDYNVRNYILRRARDAFREHRGAAGPQAAALLGEVGGAARGHAVPAPSPRTVTAPPAHRPLSTAAAAAARSPPPHGAAATRACAHPHPHSCAGDRGAGVDSPAGHDRGLLRGARAVRDAGVRGARARARRAVTRGRAAPSARCARA